VSLVELVRSPILPVASPSSIGEQPDGALPGDPPRLPPAFLAELVDGIAAATPLWRSLAAHDPVHRTNVRLLASDVYEVWLLGWSPSHRVELHDHGRSHAALRVVDGMLCELERSPSGLVRRRLPSGSGRQLRSGTVHEVLNESDAVATSIHAYSPPLSTMTFYDSSGSRPVRCEAVESGPPVLTVEHERSRRCRPGSIQR
jgi:hypothetical protein